jgi:hypothetical protein
MWDDHSSTTPNWSFALDVPPGPHELVAFSASSVLVRRGLSITGPTALPPIHMTQGGVALTSVPLTIHNLGSDALSTEVDLFLADDVAWLTGTSATVQVAPASLLLMGTEGQQITVTATGANEYRWGDSVFTGSETTFDLMPPLTGIVFDTTGGSPGATWATLPAHDGGASLDVRDRALLRRQHVYATPQWLAATGATSLAFDADPPGYDPAWKVDLAGPYRRSFSLYASTGSVGLGTAVYEEPNGAASSVADARGPRIEHEVRVPVLVPGAVNHDRELPHEARRIVGRLLAGQR